MTRSGSVFVRIPLSVMVLMAFAGVQPLDAAAQSRRAPPQPVTVATGPSYGQIAELAVIAPIVIDATIRESALVEPERAPGIAPGSRRHYVEARVNSLIRGPAGTPGSIRYLVDLPVDSRGKPARLEKQRVIVFARPGTAAGQIQLVSPAAQLPWIAGTDASVRAILAELVRPGAAPAISGIANAFHVRGSLPGEGETQIFLRTTTGAPVSLTVLRRPGQQRRWAVAFGEIVDESAQRPARDTLGWFRLACGLPRSIAPALLAGLDATEARAAQEDYAFILADLGSCGQRVGPTGA